MEESMENSDDPLLNNNHLLLIGKLFPHKIKECG